MSATAAFDRVMIIHLEHADVDELPTDLTRVAPASMVAGDAVTYAIELAELLDVDVDELARPLAPIATHRFDRLQAHI